MNSIGGPTDDFTLIRAYSGDIQEHLPTLRDLSRECSHITEMGVRHVVSSWAFAIGLCPKGKLVCIDIVPPPEENLNDIKEYCSNKKVEFGFILNSSLDIVIEETDMLFIDTLHTEPQLTEELKLHGDKARKYIVLHDTESCKELWISIGNLLAKGIWKIKKHYENNNGLTILERI